ncbi:hypothetical protein P7996_15975, partial [Staphylococcus aureus]|nr:hypothetical protein [Staphylococcus aureus]
LLLKPLPISLNTICSLGVNGFLSTKNEVINVALYSFSPLFTFTSYYISKVVKTMLQFAIAILVIFMVGHFYKGVAMSAVQW